jgi:hypothetical protein
LFALAAGVENAGGPHRCFFCAALCGAAHPADDYVRDSFTGRDSVRCPGSAWVCTGCVLCLREDAELRMHDGTLRRVTKAAMRSFSWLITERSAIAAGLGARDAIADWCLRPPPPPFAISVAISGQKHLLYRGAINHAAEPPWTITLEGERIHYMPAALAARLDLCGRLVAASGKPALAEPVSAYLAMSVLDRYRDGELLLEEFCRVRETPLTRLAGFLCPGKDVAQQQWPADVLDAGAAATA